MRVQRYCFLRYLPSFWPIISVMAVIFVLIVSIFVLCGVCRYAFCFLILFSYFAYSSSTTCMPSSLMVMRRRRYRSPMAFLYTFLLTSKRALISSASLLFFALSAKFLADYFGHGSYFCSDSQYLRPLRRMPLRFLFPYIVLIFCLFFLHHVYAIVTDGDEAAAVQVADGLLVHLLAHLEARLDLLSIALVS